MNLLLTLLIAVLAFPSDASAADLSGTVVETMNAGGYTYLRLKNPTGEKGAIPEGMEVEEPPRGERRPRDGDRNRERRDRRPRERRD